MYGPIIMARTMSSTKRLDQHGNQWQYLSRSDHHSKVACWAILFDLILRSELLRQQFAEGAIAFGINHSMRDFETDRTKVLDLVVCTHRTETSPTTQASKKTTRLKTLQSLATEYGIVLSKNEEAILGGLPLVSSAPVGAVLIALEAKATMTEHVKALPRLHDELDSSHATIHGNKDDAIAAALITINISDRFISPDRNKFSGAHAAAVESRHKQPSAAERTIGKVREIRRRSRPGSSGFDAMGIVVFDFQNDGGQCEIHTGFPAPTVSDPDNYANMIDRIHALYAAKFSRL